MELNGGIAGFKTYNQQPRNMKIENLQWRGQQSIKTIQSINSSKKKS